MSKIIPKTDENSKKFWASVEEVAREVATWPSWKKGGRSTSQTEDRSRRKEVRTGKSAG